MKLTFEFPLMVRSVANLHELPVVRHKRVLVEREATAWAVIAAGAKGKAFIRAAQSSTEKITVTLTRLCPPRNRIRDEHDNLPVSFKSVVDELAKQLGMNDGNRRITWKYAQSVGAFGVRVEMQLGAGSEAA